MIDALNRAGGLGETPAEPTPEMVASLAASVGEGDPARGERIYRRESLQCLKCHAIAGAGGKVGPGLESIGASAPDDYLVESLLIPGKAVKEGYHSLVVATDDGRIVHGIPIREADGTLVLRDAEGAEVAVSIDAIEERAQGGSLMPAGLVDPLTRDELLDLLAFLSKLGEPGDYAVGTVPVVRSWEVLQATGEAGEAIRRIGVGPAAAGDPRFSWRSVPTLVTGALPIDELPALCAYNDGPRTSLARFRVEVASAGTVRLEFKDAGALTVWVDGVEVAPGPTIDLALDPGTHAVLVAIDRDRREGDLRVVVGDAPGSSPRARPAVGE